MEREPDKDRMPEAVLQMPTVQEFQIFMELATRFPALFPAMDLRARVPVSEVVDKYLANVHEEVTERVVEYIRPWLESLRVMLGDRQVAQLSPFDLKEWMTANAHRMKSGWTKARVKSIVQRAFNWAVEMRIIRENPFKGLKLHGLEKITGRDIKEDEFQAVLRHTDAYFRRFLIALKLTGARPCELACLQWTQIDWVRGLATLKDHKTARKTGKPRTIILVPQVMKLLAVIKRDQHGPAAVELKRLLEHAPNRIVRAKEVVFKMQQIGFSYRAIYRARESIGAIYRREGGWREHGHTVYELPANAVEGKLPFGDYVFVCSKHLPWTRSSWGTKFGRLRKIIGLPKDCKLYGTRHYFATLAVKRGVNLKAVATLLGHTTTIMLEKVYAHIDGDFAFLQQAAQAATALVGNPTPMPMPIDAEAWQKILLDKYPRFMPKPKKRWKPRTQASPLRDAERIAWEAYQFAMKENPNLGTDFKVFEWLLGRREFAGQLPPSGTTFRRYLNRARHQFHGVGKRKLRRLQQEAQCQDPSHAPSTTTSPETPRPEISSANG